MDLTELEKLKEVVATCEELSTAFDYFLDHFGENEAFLSLGKPGRVPELEMFIKAVGGQMFGRCAIVNPLLIRIPGTKFVHGACTINGFPANVLYFEDIQTGILAVMGKGGRGPTKLSRFSGRRAGPGDVPSAN